MTYLLAVAADVVLIVVLTATFYHRHRRRDLVLAYLAVNIGVLAVTTVLSNSAVGAGLGLGLFGVLSIIRLRSEELAQHEIAYYFASLTVGLLGGFGDAAWWLPLLMLLIVAVIFIGDHPVMLASHSQQVVVVDRAIANKTALRERVAEILDAEIVGLSVRRLDLVNDSTVVDARFKVPKAERAASRAAR